MSRTLCTLLISSMSLVGCAKNNTRPPETAYSNTTSMSSMETVPAAQATGPANTIADPYQGATPIDPSLKPPTDSPASKIGGLSDGEIVAITETVNRGEIEQAKEAQKKSKNPQVKKFAAHMISAHTQSNKKGEAWTQKAGLTPTDSSISSELHATGQQRLEALKTATPTEVDKAYVDAQVEQHEAVLGLLNDRMIPSATNPELKAALEETRAMVEKHIAEAKKLQAAVGTGATEKKAAENEPPAG